MFVVFDLDGTLSLNEHRNHFVRRKTPDWDSYLAACGDDEVNVPIETVYQDLLNHGDDGSFVHRIEIWTGRSETVKDITLEWFERKEVTLPDTLMMRPAGDYRPDIELKAAWMAERGKPDLVFDDRSSVIQMFRSHGITAVQVAKGDF